MNAKTFTVALVALASTGFGLAAAQAQKSAAAHVVVYKSPT